MTDHPLLSLPDGGMKARALRATLATATSQVVRLLVQFGSVIVLARFLSPADFGVYAMAAPIIGFALLFQDLGLTQALVTASSLSHGQAVSLFRINVAIAGATALILMAFSPLLAEFYSEPAVAPITATLALQVLLAGLTASHLALLSRGMRFAIIAKIEITASLAGFATGVTIAVLKPGPWALVGQSLIAAAVTLCGAWAGTRWLPTGPAAFAEAKPLFRFGAGMTSFNLANFLARNADNVMIGWARGGTELGFYDRAYKLVLFPILQVNGTIGQVLVPVLSRMRDEPERYRRTYQRTVGQLLLCTAPGVVFLFANAESLIRLMLGETWLPAVPIFQWLCLAAAHKIVSNTFGLLFITQQRTTEYAQLGIFNTVTTLLAFGAGLPWGAVGVAATYAVSGVLVRLPAIIWVVGGRGPVARLDILQMFWPYVVAMGASLVAWRVVDAASVLDANVKLLVSLGFIYAVCWLVLSLTRTGRKTYRDTLELARDLMASRK